MSATNAFETALLQLYFNNVDHANIGDAAGLQNSAVAGDFFVSLHTADPGEAGSQTTSEAAYTGYGRVAVARTAGGWTVSGNNVSNTAVVTFGQKTAGADETLTHFGIGSASSGAGNLFWKGALTASRLISNGITPSFAAGELDVNAD
jgi:hypothetical protein